MTRVARVLLRTMRGIVEPGECPIQVSSLNELLSVIAARRPARDERRYVGAPGRMSSVFSRTQRRF